MFSICEEESNGLDENKLFEVVGASDFEGDPKLNNGFAVVALPEALSLCDLPANRLANGFLGPASSRAWLLSAVSGFSAGFNPSFADDASSAGETRPNRELDGDGVSAGFDSEPNGLLLSGCDDDGAPAVCPNMNPDFAGGAPAGSNCEVVPAG